MRTAATDRARRIALVGLRGAGKSTLGRMLAEKLGVPFIELDRMVEQQYGASVPLLIEMSGVATFKRHERICLERVIAENEAAVIATAGGIVSNPETYGLLLRRTHTVWISAQPEEHMSRVMKQGDFRPMAKNREAMADLHAILEARRVDYARAEADARYVGRDRAAELREAAEARRALDERLSSMADAERKLVERQGRIDFATDPAALSPLEALRSTATLPRCLMDVDENAPLFEGYQLKLNSYDLGVDIELADALERLRFEHPEVRVVLLRSGKPRVFCAGANIRMLAGATHAHKVNFCKFTNETRNAIEDASEFSGQRTICVVTGSCAGGGYELALAADHIILTDDGSSTVSLPELPLLAVLPGTGGLTRVTDKRKVRRDHADVFCTTEEGVKGKRAVEWRLVDEVVPNSKLDEVVKRARARVRREVGPPERTPKASRSSRSSAAHQPTGVEYSARVGGVRARRAARDHHAARPGRAAAGDPPTRWSAQGAAFWPLRLARELDDAILDIRLNEFDIAVIVFKSEGDPKAVLAYDAFLAEHNAEHWLAREIALKWKRVLKRVDLTSRSLVTLIEPGSCFAGTLAELIFAADRSYMLIGQTRRRQPPAGRDRRWARRISGAYPMGNGSSRLATRFLGEPRIARSGARGDRRRRSTPRPREELGLVTFALDDIDWEDEIRVFLEERASFSPDALTGMEANLRFGGPETMETKIFARLTAWQNWIFQRPNAVGEEGALRRYGTGQKAVFDTEDGFERSVR